jgi:hypothetical protein
MKGFGEYLQRHPEVLPADVPADEIDEFHYGKWLLAHGYDFKDDQAEAPLFLDYLRFQREQITRYFGELADYARSFARSRGRDVLVSGNFFNLQDHYLPLEPSVDVIVTEMRNTTYRQPAWYRYAAGFAQGKPVVVVENPYGGIVPELVRDLKSGRGFDLFRMSVYEAAALGANMTIPYGAWMGSVIEDSFWPPHDLCVEVQEWLAAHDGLLAGESAARTAVVFSTESNFLLETRDRELANNTLNLTSDESVPFWTVCSTLSDTLQPYDVVFFPDGELRPDEVTGADLAAYSTVVLPHCHQLTEAQAQALLDYLDSGGRITRIGPLGTNLGAELRTSLESHNGTREASGTTVALEQLVERPQVRASAQVDAAIDLRRVDNGVAVHLIRYDYDPAADCVPQLDALTIDIDLEGMYDTLDALGAPKPPDAQLEHRDGGYRLVLSGVPLYSVAVLRGDRGGKGERK